MGNLEKRDGLKTIVIDLRPLMGGKTSGVEIYIQNLLENLFKIDKKNIYILFTNSHQKQKLPEFKQKNVIFVHTEIPNKLLNLSLFLFKKPKLDKLILKKLKNFYKKIDLFFMPDLRPSALSKNVKKIITVHDLSFEHFPKFFSFKTNLWYKILNPKKEIKQSHKIITVSNFTKQDLIKTYKIDKVKIEVIYHGIEEDFCRYAEAVRNLPEKYFLFLSTIEPRKNLENLIKAFRIFKQNNLNEIKLVIAGSKNKKIFSKVNLDTDSDIIFTGFIPNKNKAAIIKNALAFIYPSLFEGFGLPLLEAMKCNTPIITSNNSSIPEVVLDAAILIQNPNNPNEITTALEKVLDPKIKENLKQKMLERIKDFSWQKTAEQTLDTFKQLLL